jgi:hypothetical protein
MRADVEGRDVKELKLEADDVKQVKLEVDDEEVIVLDDEDEVVEIKGTQRVDNEETEHTLVDIDSSTLLYAGVHSSSRAGVHASRRRKCSGAHIKAHRSDTKSSQSKSNRKQKSGLTRQYTRADSADKKNGSVTKDMSIGQVHREHSRSSRTDGGDAAAGITAKRAGDAGKGGSAQDMHGDDEEDEDEHAVILISDTEVRVFFFLCVDIVSFVVCMIVRCFCFVCVCVSLCFLCAISFELTICPSVDKLVLTYT